MCDDRDARRDDSDACDEHDVPDGRDSLPPDCPTCGESVHVVTASGPYAGTAFPCGCSVGPGRITRDHDGREVDGRTQ
ncbi:hypothetical protein [Natrinema salsiterrestre]|uniref:Small CPxCG-related zinc finger protein n=1 Tax=Natrinema salsiterrestre TaxID=2950540 RepID=A0A9Q4L5B5_9EURY|nr:hypothetical protein [Natrinema salsiterrestre]MDF9746817.1 hypothetical protein [Natrinema salsiterrestre]